MSTSHMAARNDHAQTPASCSELELHIGFPLLRRAPCRFLISILNALSFFKPIKGIMTDDDPNCQACFRKTDCKMS